MNFESLFINIKVKIEKKEEKRDPDENLICQLLQGH